jgi:hypothetical protein
MRGGTDGAAPGCRSWPGPGSGNGTTYTCAPPEISGRIQVNPRDGFYHAIRAAGMLRASHPTATRATCDDLCWLHLQRICSHAPLTSLILRSEAATPLWQFYRRSSQRLRRHAAQRPQGAEPTRENMLRSQLEPEIHVLLQRPESFRWETTDRLRRRTRKYTSLDQLGQADRRIKMTD